MTLEEAKEYYKFFNGSSFQMGREDMGTYREFKSLNLTEEQLREWDEELLDELYANKKDIWWSHYLIIQILFRKNIDLEKEVTRFLDYMETANSFPLGTLGHMIHQMAGSTSRQTDGAVYLICQKTKQGKRMKEVMEPLLHKETKDPYYKDAVSKYNEALRRYYRGK